MTGIIDMIILCKAGEDDIDNIDDMMMTMGVVECGVLLF